MFGFCLEFLHLEKNPRKTKIDIEFFLELFQIGKNPWKNLNLLHGIAAVYAYRYLVHAFPIKFLNKKHEFFRSISILKQI